MDLGEPSLPPPLPQRELADEISARDENLQNILSQLSSGITVANSAANAAELLLSRVAGSLNRSAGLLAESRGRINTSRSTLGNLRGRLSQLEDQIEQNEADIIVARNLTTEADTAANTTAAVSSIIATAYIKCKHFWDR